MTTFTEEQALDAFCWSADVDGLDVLMDTIDAMPRLRKIKIDRLFVDTYGPEVFQLLVENYPELLVFFDAKYAEIPTKLAELAKIGCSHRPWMLNCMADCLSNGDFSNADQKKLDGLKQFADICHDNSVQPCAVSVLTTKTDRMTTYQFNGRNRVEQVLFYAEHLVEAGFTHIVFSGATGMAPVTLRIQCVSFDPEDAVRMGITALPNANAGANGGLPLGDASGRVDIGKLLGTAWLTPATAGTPDVNVKLWNGLTTVALPLTPTTAGRTLDVSATGEAGIDFANIGSPTTTVNLSGTTVGTVTALASTERTSIADAILTRDLSALGASASRCLLRALRFLLNKRTVVGTTLAVYREDDTTTDWTATVGTDASADPITSVDPT